MIGLQATTFSPSSSSATRSTPCVLGCWGPMLSVMVSLRTVADLLGSEFLQGRRGFDAARRVVRERHLFVAERGVLAERPAHPVLGKQDAGQVRVPGERDPVEVVRLTLVPVRRGPDAGHGGHARLLLGYADFEREPSLVRDGEQAVGALEARHARQ